MAKNRFYPFAGEQMCKRIGSLIVFTFIAAAVSFADVIAIMQFQTVYLIVSAIIFAYFLFNFLYSTIYLEFYDPGFVTNNPEAGYLETCDKCNFTRPYRAHHCSVCQKCVRKYDHHCDVFNYCIAAWSLPYFLKFFASATLFLLCSIAVELAAFLIRKSVYTIVLIIGLIASAVLLCFAVFSCAGLAWQPIFRNCTQVEEQRQEHYYDKGICNNARRALGRFWGIGFFIPAWKFDGVE